MTSSVSSPSWRVLHKQVSVTVMLIMRCQCVYVCTTRAVLHTMEDLLKEGIIAVNKETGETVVLKELSENSLNVG